MDTDRRSELHVCTTGQLFSYRVTGTGMEERTGVFSAFRYGTAPDAVLITYAIQGEGYFEAIVDHFDAITQGCKCVMGYVWTRHVDIYRRVLRDRAREVEVLFTGHPYGDDGPEMAWVIAWLD